MRHLKMLRTGPALSVLVLSTSLAAQTTPSTPPAPAPLLEEWLGGHFDAMMQACLPGLGKIRFKEKIPSGGKDAPRIPREIASRLNLASKPSYQIFGSANMTRLFGYVYSKADTENIANIADDPSRYLNVDYDRDKDQIIESGLGNLIYNQDCSGAVKAAASANGNVPLGPATLSAAANSALEGKFRARTSIVQGRFASPVVRQWHMMGNDPLRSQKLRFYTALLLWDWYRRNPTAGTENHLLYAIDGVSLYRFQSRSTDVNLDASVKAGFAIPLISVSTQVSGELARTTALDIDTYSFVVTKPSTATEPYKFEPMPPLATVLAAISQNPPTKPRLLAGDSDVVRVGVPKSFEVDVEAMPAGYCDGRYGASGADADQITIRRVTWETVNLSEAACRFLVEYFPPATLSGEGSHWVRFNIAMPQGTLPNAVTAFTIPVAVEFQKTDNPKLELLAPVALPTVTVIGTTPPQTRLSWTANLRLWDENQIQDDTQVNTSALYMADCPVDARRQGDFTIDRTLTTRQNTQNRPVNLMIHANYLEAPVNWQANASKCRLRGSIAYKIGGRTVMRAAPEIYIAVPTPAAPVP